MLQPIFESLGETRLDNFVDEYCQDSMAQLAVAIWSDDPARSIEDAIYGWREERTTTYIQKILEQNEKRN